MVALENRKMLKFYFFKENNEITEILETKNYEDSGKITSFIVHSEEEVSESSKSCKISILTLNRTLITLRVGISFERNYIQNLLKIQLPSKSTIEELGSEIAFNEKNNIICAHLSKLYGMKYFASSLIFLKSDLENKNYEILKKVDIHRDGLLMFGFLNFFFNDFLACFTVGEKCRCVVYKADFGEEGEVFEVGFGGEEGVIGNGQIRGFGGVVEGEGVFGGMGCAGDGRVFRFLFERSKR